jgi:acyl-CoA reductase-like NAD-dependent aldehyde dehydrogenase
MTRADPDAALGAFKYSGIGREFGRYRIEAFLETRAILERPLLACRHEFNKGTSS